MPANAVVIYHIWSNLEWATKYWFAEADTTNREEQAIAVGNAEAPLISDNILINRYEAINAAGVKTSEGALSIAGENTTDMMPINYALFIRLISSGPKRPSTKYIHGWCENMQTDGDANVTLSTAVTAYGAELIAIDVTDSDGVAINGVVFRRFSRRRHMRRPL